MLTIIVFLLVSVIYLQYLLYLMHMFQLNTYKSNEQRAWMKKTSAAMNRYTTFLSPALCFWYFHLQLARNHRWLGILAFTAAVFLLALQILRNRPKQKAKKRNKKKNMRKQKERQKKMERKFLQRRNR